jgi:2-dehydro-3-deoxyphosphogluconate aldolase / (4S)-4-hydroxy-2-oxoglutarate aldolase
MSVLALLGGDRVIPVVTIAAVEDALPLAEAVLAGGLSTIEVTLRSPAALPAIRAIADRYPDLAVGAGTVTDADSVVRAVDAGARFLVTPGITDGLWAALAESGAPYICGCVTPSELMLLRDLGITEAKLFPAEACGGRALLRALAGPFPEMRFCPTGGIGADLVASYLAEPNVFAVGCSWITAAAANQDWDAVREAAAGAAGFAA